MPKQAANRPANAHYQDLLVDFEGWDFSQFGASHVQPREEEPGFWDKAWESGKAFAEGLTFLPGGIADTAKAAWNGGDIDVTDADALRERAETEREKQAYLQKYRSKTFEGVGDAMMSLPYSLTTMAGTVGAGTAALPAGPVAAGAAGMAASGAVAYRATKNDFLHQILDITQEVLGRMPTQDEWNRVANYVDAEATTYGLWEAGPEALSNLLMGKILGPLGSKFKGGIKEGIKKIAGLYGEEFATETVTQMGQGAIEADLGMRDAAPGMLEAFRETAPATFWQTTLMAGGKKGMDTLRNRWRGDQGADADIGPSPEKGASPEEGSRISPSTISPAEGGARAAEFSELSGLSGPQWNAPPAPMDEAAWNREASARGWKHLRTDARPRNDFDTAYDEAQSWAAEQKRLSDLEQLPTAGGLSAALRAGDTVDLMTWGGAEERSLFVREGLPPADRREMLPAAGGFGGQALPPGTGAVPMGTRATGQEPIAPPTDFAGAPMATPFIPRPALPQQAGPSAGPGRWAGGKSQLAYGGGMMQGLGFMDGQGGAPAAPIPAMPTASQVANTQTAPRADTTAQAEALGMPALPALPPEAQAQQEQSVTPVTPPLFTAQIPEDFLRSHVVGDTAPLFHRQQNGPAQAGEKPRPSAPPGGYRYILPSFVTGQYRQEKLKAEAKFRESKSEGAKDAYESRADVPQQLPPESRREARRLTNARRRERLRTERNPGTSKTRQSDPRRERDSLRRRTGVPFPQEGELHETIAEAAGIQAELAEEGQQRNQTETAREDAAPLASLKDSPSRRSDATPVRVVEAPEGVVPEFKKTRDLAKWLKGYFADKREETIFSTGKKVRFGNSNLEASLKRGREAKHNQAYAGLNDLVRWAEFDSFEAKDERHPNLGGQEVYYAALRIGEDMYAVKLKFDIPSEAEIQYRKGILKENTLEDLRYKDHSLREIEIAPVLYRGPAHDKVGSTQATGAIHTITLGVLRGSVNPSRLENDSLASLGERPVPRPDATPVRVVEAPEGVVPEFSRVRDLAKWLHGFFASKRYETIEATGKRVLFSNAGLDASLKKIREKGHTGTYGSLTDLVRKAEYDSFVPTDARHPMLGGQEIYYSAMRMRNALYAVKMKFDVPGKEEIATRRKLAGSMSEIEDLRYKDHTLREIKIAPVAVNYGFEGHTAAGAIRTITLGVLRGAVNPSRLENGALSSIAPGEYLPPRRNAEIGLRAGAVQRVADALGKTAGNAASVRVVQHFEELPISIRKKHVGNAAAVEGVYDPRSRTVWLVADNLADTGRVAEVWAHEQIVHHGLRGLLSDAERKAVLNQLWAGLGGMSNGTIREIADRYGLNPRADEKVRQTVMEEVIAALAEKRQFNALTPQEARWWQRIVAAVARAWERLVRAVTGRAPRMKPGDIDELLSALGRYVMEGVPKGTRGQSDMAVQAFAAMGEDREAAGRAAWEQVRKDTEAWKRQLDEFANGRENKIRGLTVGTTPNVLQRLGAKPLPMEMARHNLAKVLMKHGVPLDVLRDLPQHLADPLMVFKSATMADAYVVLTEMERNGENLVAAIHFDVEAGRARINDIASIHDRSTVRDTGEKIPGWVWIKNQIAAGNLRYYDKTRSSRWFRELSGLQLSGVMNRESYRGVKILTEKDVVKPVAPESIQKDDAPLASLSARDILGMTVRGAARSADAPEIRHMFRKNDISLLQGIVQLPHWIAKQAPAFAKVYERQLQRMDERSAGLKAGLETVPRIFGKDRLQAADMDSLRKLLWEHEGKEPKALEGVEKFLTEETLVTGRELIKVNPEFYDAYQTWLDGLEGTRAAKAAMLEIRKSLDQDLVLAHNRMAAMSEMSDDAIREFRQSIGHVPNYFPHHRYGKYFVQAKVGDEVVFRQHFDAPGEKAAMAKARKIVEEQREKYPDAVWADGKNDRLPDEVLGAPIDSEAMEQIIRAATAKIGDKERAGEIADLLTQGVADVLKARGWGAHGIQRKGIPGFETEDIAKVLYDYKAGLNGWLTKMEAARDFSEALSHIDARTTPNLWKYTAQYVKDMLRNSDRVDRITGNIKTVAFAWYLGGSIKTAFVNATQNLVVGVPRLQMDVMGGGREWLAGARSALVDRVTGNKGKGLTEEEARLVRELYGESVITDAFMEEVRGQLRGVSGASLWNKFTRVLGWPMSEVERFNRASLALAAFRAARDGKLKARAREKYGVNGKASYEQAKAFAADVVRDAHFVYGKSNMPEFMRSNTAGRAMSSMYTFRTFTHNMIAMWSWALRTQGREGAAFAAKSLGATMALGGVTALPLYATLMALFQAVTGDDDDWTELIRSHLPESNLLRDVVCYGAPAMAGVNIGGSLKMETPLTRGLTRGKTYQEVLTDSLGDIIGIPYDLLVVKPSRVMEARSKGNTYRMIEEASPVLMRNAMQAWRLWREGQTTMTGRPINAPGAKGARKLTGAEAAGKALGFQPVSSTKSYDAYAATKHAEQVRSDKIDELTVLALKTYDTGDSAGRREANRELREWNEKMKAEGKPHMLITLKDVMRRVKARRRENRATPKAMQKKVRMEAVWG